MPRATSLRRRNDLQLRAMHVRDRVVTRGEEIEEVFFPLNCVLSTVAHGAEDEVVEVATVGNEGKAGITVFLGATTRSTLDTYAQVPGDALAMRVRDSRTHLRDHPKLRETLALYTQALITQISQASACNQLHPADERCARRLLTRDRVGQEELKLTQEFLAQMLGVRRATVSAVATALQSEGIIRYTRGSIAILNPEALLERSCECYRIIRDEYERLMP